MASPNFIDYVKLFLKSGRGGAGSAHFHRDRLTSKGGPDGGDGGRGGHIIIKGNKQLWTLLHLKYRKHIKAKSGNYGTGGGRTGADGDDEIIEVPLGTIARDAETGVQECEITEDGQEFILIPGGRGGLGNTHFKSSTRQTPEYAQPGEDHQEGWKVLELKVLADVGLVGFPNAGKSTLLSVVSAAKPEIANYPFTTLVPNLGVVPHNDGYRSFVMADIPGIIEGANEGKGLGHRFLRHIERNSILLFVISCDTNSILDEYNILVKELELYNKELLHKERLIAITKADLLDEELEQALKDELPKDMKTIFISSFTKKGIPQLKNMIWDSLN